MCGTCSVCVCKRHSLQACVLNNKLRMAASEPAGHHDRNLWTKSMAEVTSSTDLETAVIERSRPSGPRSASRRLFQPHRGVVVACWVEVAVEQERRPLELPNGLYDRKTGLVYVGVVLGPRNCAGQNVLGREHTAAGLEVLQVSQLVGRKL